MVDQNNQKARRRFAPRRYLRLIALLIAGAVVAQGIAGRVHQEADLQQWTATQAIPTVSVVLPDTSANGQALTLPGRLAANYDAPIYARVSGYLKNWNVDIGAHVKKGQVLAEIETPDLDAQYSQAQAELANAVAADQLAGTTAGRWKEMLESDSVSQQAVDEKTGDWQVKQASVASARANVARLQALESYRVIAAPFDGIVTERRTDIGDLVNAGSGEGQALFRVADEQKLRVYVDVPQNYASDIGARIRATLTVPERPGESFVAQYLSTASAIDSASGTVTIELMCDNADGKLIPGAYTQVHLTLGSTASPTMRLPSSTLILGHQGEEVATVASNGQVTMKKVTIARDLGAEVEISAGISASDRVVDNPPDSLADGDTVRIASHAGSRLAAAKTAGGPHAQS